MLQSQIYFRYDVLAYFREELQQLCSGLIEKIQATLADVLGKAKLTVEDIHSVEIIGGSCRIPAVKEVITDVFKKPPSTMLNMDEGVARGCALQVSNGFKIALQLYISFLLVCHIVPDISCQRFQHH